MDHSPQLLLALKSLRLKRERSSVFHSMRLKGELPNSLKKGAWDARQRMLGRLNLFTSRSMHSALHAMGEITLLPKLMLERVSLPHSPLRTSM